MRRHQSGAGCGTSGRDSQSRPGAALGTTNRVGALTGRPRAETRRRQIAEDAAWRADWRTLPKFSACSARHPLAFGGRKKRARRANPRAQAKQQGPISHGCLTIEYEEPSRG